MECDISFIGLGRMGYGMATNIRQKLSSKSTMYINDVNASACENFVKESKDYGPVEIVSTAKEAASKSQVVISMVPAASHVRQVYLDKDNGVLAAPKDDDRLVLECSTIDADTTRECGKAIMDAGIGRYVDAPVSGGVHGAKDAKLAFMIGCHDSDSQAKRIRDIVSMMGPPNKTFFCGDLGNGLACKISNNYLSGTFLMAISEAMAMGIKAGVDKNVLADVISNSSGFSWMSENMNPVPGVIPTAPSSHDYKVSFPAELMVKDVGLGIDAGQKVGIDPSMGKTAVEWFKKAVEDPRTKGKDVSAVYLLVNDENSR